MQWIEESFESLFLETNNVTAWKILRAHKKTYLKTI